MKPITLNFENEDINFINVIILFLFVYLSIIVIKNEDVKIMRYYV